MEGVVGKGRRLRRSLLRQGFSSRSAPPRGGPTSPAHHGGQLAPLLKDEHRLEYRQSPRLRGWTDCAVNGQRWEDRVRPSVGPPRIFRPYCSRSGAARAWEGSNRGINAHAPRISLLAMWVCRAQLELRLLLRAAFIAGKRRHDARSLPFRRPFNHAPQGRGPCFASVAHHPSVRNQPDRRDQTYAAIRPIPTAGSICHSKSRADLP